MKSHARDFLKLAQETAEKVDCNAVEKVVLHILKVREKGGRLFFLGVGGSAANCSHAVNDFRKLAHIESYSPVDNVSELTARTNDEGFDRVFEAYLKTSRLNSNDAIFIMSVGGGNKEKNVSVNLIHASDYAKSVGAAVLGIVGRDGGYTAKVADACIIVPTVADSFVTPLVEGFQGVIWHLIISDPRILAGKMTWESLSAPQLKIAKAK